MKTMLRCVTLILWLFSPAICLPQNSTVQCTIINSSQGNITNLTVVCNWAWGSLPMQYQNTCTGSPGQDPGGPNSVQMSGTYSGVIQAGTSVNLDLSTSVSYAGMNANGQVATGNYWTTTTGSFPDSAHPLQCQSTLEDGDDHQQQNGCNDYPAWSDFFVGSECHMTFTTTAVSTNMTNEVFGLKNTSGYPSTFSFGYVDSSGVLHTFPSESTADFQAGSNNWSNTQTLDGNAQGGFVVAVDAGDAGNITAYQDNGNNMFNSDGSPEWVNSGIGPDYGIPSSAGDSSAPNATQPAVTTVIPTYQNPFTGGTNVTTGQQVFTPIPTYQASNSSPILWTGAASTNSNTATEQGDSAIYSAMQTANALLTTANSNLASIANSTAQGAANSGNGGTNGGQGGTNIYFGGTNVFVENWPAGYSNYLAGIYTNTLTYGGTNSSLTIQQISNYDLTISNGLQESFPGALAGIYAQTNLAGAVNMSGIIGAVPSTWSLTENLGSQGGDVSSDPIEFASGVNGFSLQMKTSTISSYYSDIYSVCKWFLLIMTFFSCWTDFSNAMKNVLLTQQATTAGQAFMGTNANYLSALTMAGVVIALCATMAAFAGSIFAGYIMSIGDIPPISDSFALGFVSEFIPWPLALSCVGVCCLFRLIIDTIMFTMQAIVKLLVGL